MGDLRVIDGGKEDPPDLPVSQVICASCNSGLFNWKADDSGKIHILSCAVCSTLFPMVEHDESHCLKDWGDDDG